MKRLQMFLAIVAGIGIFLSSHAFAQQAEPVPSDSNNSPQIISPGDQPNPEDPDYVNPEDDEQDGDQAPPGQEEDGG